MHPHIDDAAGSYHPEDFHLVPDFIAVELIVYGDGSDCSGELACRKLMALEERPDALFCMNDWMAVGAMKVLKELGVSIGEDSCRRIPEGCPSGAAL